MDFTTCMKMNMIWGRTMMIKSCKNDIVVPLMFIFFFHRHMRVACAWQLVIVNQYYYIDSVLICTCRSFTVLRKLVSVGAGCKIS